MNQTGRSILWSLLAVFMLVTDCSKLTQKNCDKLKIGMEYSEVISLLGQADTCDSVMLMKSCTWGKEDKQIRVQFVSDKVVIYTCKGL